MYVHKYRDFVGGILIHRVYIETLKPTKGLIMWAQIGVMQEMAALV